MPFIVQTVAKFLDLVLELERPLMAWTPSSRLVEDLLLDSLGFYEIVMEMADLGAEIPEQKVRHVVSLGDLYDHYLNAHEALPRG